LNTEELNHGAGLDILAHLSSLRFLDVGQNDQITVTGLERLKAMPSLRKLHASSSKNIDRPNSWQKRATESDEWESGL
jgi:hypothetical protein